MPTHRPVVLVFGRFNPPTTGHEALIAFVKNIAHRVNADVRIYASQSQDARKNPLPFRVKIQYLRRFFPGVTFSDSTAIRTPFDALGELSQLGYTDVILVAGSDRVRDYEKLGTYLLPRNSPKYDSTKHIAINSYKVVSVPGDRDPDAEGVSGMSASKLRKLAADNDYTAFRQGIPSHASERDAKNLFKQVRQYMGLHETFKVRAGQFAVGLFLDEAFINHRQFAAKGKMHPDFAKHMRVGQYMDYYEPGTGDKVQGKVLYTSPKEVRLKRAHDSYHPRKVGSIDTFVVTDKLDEATFYGPGGAFSKATQRALTKYGQTHSTAKSDVLKVGDKVHAGLAQRGGAGFSGVVDRIEHDYVYVNIGKDKYGDRIIKAPHRNVMKEADELSEAPSAMPLRGHAYHRKSDAELLYIIKDAGAAAVAMRGHNPTAEGKYLDQVNDASTVLYYRRHGGKQVTEADAGYTPAKPETETDRLRTSQQQELIALKTRQANQMMAAKLRDVQNKAREAQMKATQPKPAAKPAS